MINLNGRYMLSGAQVLVIVILLFALSIFWLNHQEDATKIQQLENNLSNLNLRYVNLKDNYNSLEKDYNQLKIEYNIFKKDTSDLLIEHFAKEVAWDITGLSKYKTLICALQIYLRESIPMVNSIPC